MKILVPVDGSEPALDAVRYALRLQREGLPASFVLATVRESSVLLEFISTPRNEVLQKLSGAVESRMLESAEALFKAASVPFQREIGDGDPAQALIAIAERCGCESIIMGARGIGALRGALIGSVSLAVLYGSKVPVTIVKHQDGGDSHRGD